MSMKTTSIKKKLPITINMRLAGQDRLVDVDNVLQFFRELDVDATKIKSRMTLEITYKGNTLRRIYNIIQTKKMLVNDITKQIWAKYINNSLGIIVKDYV
mgnify:CR=1 FL=1